MRLRLILLISAAAVLGAVAVVVSLASDEPGHQPAPPRATTRPDPWMPDGPTDHALLWAVGDGGVNESIGSFYARAVGTLVESDGATDRLLYLGDVYPDGTEEDYLDGYHLEFGHLADRTAPTPGNHEWPSRAAGYDPYWRHFRGVTPPEWYRFEIAGWEILALNSETPRRAEQLRWLRTQLRARGTCRLAFMHRPRYSGGKEGSDESLEPFWHALQDHAVVFLSGHDHNMQRFRARGTLTQYVSGAGGYGLYPLDRTFPGLVFGDNKHFGALRIELEPGRAELAFKTYEGRTLDSSVVRCDPLAGE